MNIVLRVPTIGSDVGLNAMSFNCGYALFSLPFIAAGWYGVKYQKETSLRVYMYYQAWTWIMDTFFLVLAFIV